MTIPTTPPDTRWIGVTTPGGTVMHWKQVTDAWKPGTMGTTLCGRTRVLSIDHYGLRTCGKCEYILNEKGF